MEKLIENLLESVFEKVSRQQVKWTVHSPNRQKFEEAASDALSIFWVCLDKLFENERF